MAGINANLKVRGEKELVLKRDEAYIGVLIDDLVTKGVDEPYRMFTSRAEFRILLRQDNADERLTEKSHKLGLASEDRYSKYILKNKSKIDYLKILNSITVKPLEINTFLKENFTSEINQSQKVIDLISRPQVNLKKINNYLKLKSELTNCIVDDEILESLDIQIKYCGYIEKEKELADKAKRLEDIVIPKNFDFSKINSLSTEAKMKLKRIMPSSIGQASRISGVSPSDINVLLIFMGR